MDATDKIRRTVNWIRYADINVDYRARLEAPEFFNSSKIVVQLNFNYIEKEFTTKYFGVLDIMAKVGGLQASILPIMRIATPWFALAFLL